VRHCAGAIVTATLACFVGQVSSSVACGYHGALGNGFTAQHPRSIEVAIAVRDALDRGDITDIQRLPALTQYARVGRWLEDLRRRLARVSDLQEPTPIALLLVESGLWTRYRIDAGGLAYAPHIAGPASDDAVVLTAEPVLKSLIERKISAEVAIGYGLLVVADPSSTGQRARDALRLAFSGPD
jgi:hypothetical protein